MNTHTLKKSTGILLMAAAIFATSFQAVLATTLTDGMPATYVLGQPDDSTSSGAATATKQNFPNGTTYDSVNQRVFVADTSNNRVLVYNISGGYSTGMAATYVLGQGSLTSDSAGTTSTTLNSPLGVAYDAARKYLFVSDQSNNRVVVYDLSAGITSGMAAVNVLGQPDLSSSGNATTNNGLDTPATIAFDDATKYLYVTDSNNSRVMVFDTTSITNGEAAVNVLGQADFTSNGFSTTDSSFFFPKGVALGSNNRLFVGDTGNSRVLVFNVASITNGEAAVNVLGQTDFMSNPSPSSTDDSTMSPWGVTFDSTNNRLFVADQGSSRVLVFNTASITNGEAAVNVLGQTDFTSFTSFMHTTDGIHHYQTTGVYYAPSSQYLFVSDNSHSRTLVYDLSVADSTAPSLSQTTPVTTPSTNTTPSYSFTTDEAGTISYGGSCSSATTNATVGVNTITFNTLPVGTYSNCTITVTDGSNNASTSLAVASFTITAPSSGGSSASISAGSIAGGMAYGCTDLKALNYNKNTYHKQELCAYSPATAQSGLIVLKIGMKGSAVIKLQELLNKAGIVVGTDGAFGKKTKAAVVKFQTSKVLSADGIVGIKTWSALGI